jgi:hypothetical protein
LTAPEQISARNARCSSSSRSRSRRAHPDTAPNQTSPARSPALFCPGGPADSSPGQGPPERSAGRPPHWVPGKDSSSPSHALRAHGRGEGGRVSLPSWGQRPDAPGHTRLQSKLQLLYCAAVGCVPQEAGRTLAPRDPRSRGGPAAFIPLTDNRRPAVPNFATLSASLGSVADLSGRCASHAPTSPLKASPARSAADGKPACGEQASVRARRRLARFWERGGAHSAGGARRGKVAASLQAATAEPKSAAQASTGIEAR